MSMQPAMDRERAEDEAADWLVALSERPDDPDLRCRFEEWWAASAINAEIWARTRRAYGLAGAAPPRHADHWHGYAGVRPVERTLPAPDPERVGGRTSSPAPARHRAATGAVAAFAVAACLALAVVLPDVLLWWEADTMTATGEARSLVLEDGSRVELAPESAVDLAFTADARTVRLLQGDAFFEVSLDAGRPFRVAAGETTATVFGTAFEVRRGGNGATVAVHHGRVRVDDASTAPPTRVELGDGDWIRVTWHGGAVRGTRPAEEIATWRDGTLIARDRPVGEIVAELRRYYRGAILVQSDAFASRRVSGIYRLHDPAATLRELAASHGAVVRQVSPWLLVVTDW